MLLKRRQLVPDPVGTCFSWYMLHLVPANVGPCYNCYMRVSSTLGANFPLNQSLLHLCQPISVPVFANQSETFLEWFYFRQAWWVLLPGQPASKYRWLGEEMQTRQANTNSGQKKYSRADSKCGQNKPTYIYLIKHLFGNLELLTSNWHLQFHRHL